MAGFLPIGGSGGGGEGFALGPIDNIFGTASGSGDLSGITPAASLSAAETVRDNYQSANSGWIDGYTDLDVNIILYYTASGDPIIQYQRRIGSSWVNNGSPIVAIQGEPGSATDFSGVGAGNIPVIGNSPDYTPESSGIRIDATTNRLIADKGLEVPPGTLYIGPSTALSAAIRSVHLRSDITDNTALVLAQLYDDTTGFSRAFTYSGDTIDVVNINDPAGTDNSDTAIFNFDTTADELLIQIDVPTTQISTAVDFEVVARTTSQSGPIAFQIEGSITTDVSGVASINLREDYNPILVDSGTTLYFNITCEGMIGDDQGGGVFVPNAAVTRIVVERLNIPLGEDFTTALKNKLDGIATGATAGIVVEDEGSALAADALRLNFTGDGVEASGTGSEKTITIPGGIAGVAVEDEGTELSTGVTTLNFEGAGVQAVGSGDTIRIVIAGGGVTPPQADHTNYIDVTTDSNAANVDIDNAVSSDELNPTVTLETFTGNAYIQILQSQAHTQFTSILISGVNQLGGFTINENARTIGGQAYRQYVTTNQITDSLSGAQITMGGAT